MTRPKLRPGRLCKAMRKTMAAVAEPGTRVPRLYRRWECVNDNNPDNNSWRAFAMIVLLGICIVAFSIVLLRYAVINHCSTISKILLGGACAIHTTIIILGIIGFVIRASLI